MRTAPLEHLCAAASNQAAGFEDRPPRPWMPTATSRCTRWALLIVAAGAVGVLLGLALQPRSPPPTTPALHRSAGGAVAAARPDLPARRAPDDGGPVQVSDKGIALDLRGIEFRRAVTLLAQATGTRLHGLRELEERTDRIDLEWKGREPLGAWRALLGGRIGHTASCRAQQCDVWLVGTPPAATVSPHRAPATPHDARATPPPATMSATVAVPDAGTQASDSPEWVAPSSHGAEDQSD